MNDDEPLPRPVRLKHFTPLRYPGGKGKLTSYVKQIISSNDLLDGDYVEPYAGGAAVALELLFHEYVSRIHINDLSRSVYSFWHSVLNQPEELCRLVIDTPRTVRSWDAQKRIVSNAEDHDLLEVGFATFFLNRTNRSGILNAGIIGGRDQSGPWKIDARYNASELVHRIQAIARMRSRIHLSNLDAITFLRGGLEKWPAKTLIYSDPPYYVKGRDLYYHFYQHSDHEAVAEFIRSEIQRQQWIVSYDNVAPIRELYDGFQRVIYGIGYSARGARTGSEVMFFSNGLTTPALSGPITAIEELGCIAV